MVELVDNHDVELCRASPGYPAVPTGLGAVYAEDLAQIPDSTNNSRSSLLVQQLP